ncbi:uncharacterized protein TNCV_2946421 [Trichonephila clavipes]|nr:uncharacterized protein TNCV_2946421 [Trichonephila clavipes]
MAIPKHSHLLLHPICMEKISQFQKIECVGHVQKRMGTRLRKLKQMSSKLSDGKSIGGKTRLTDRMIDLITTYYGNAIRQNKTCLSDMRKAVWSVYFHIRSSDEEPLHSFCPVGPNSWCKYQNQVAEGSVETFRHSIKLPVAVMDVIKPVFNDLSQPKLLQKCLGIADYPSEKSVNVLDETKQLSCGAVIAGCRKKQRTDETNRTHLVAALTWMTGKLCA